MIWIDLVPDKLKIQFDTFWHQLNNLNNPTIAKCPYCNSEQFMKTRANPLTFRCKLCHKYFNPLTHTPFNRLPPIELISTIFAQRVARNSYQTIADNVACSVRQIRQRDRAIKQYMQAYPDLLTWYSLDDKQLIASELVKHQQHTCINKIKNLLTIKQIDCQFCGIGQAVKINQRTGFRCKKCHKSFNLLSDTPLNKMPHADKWIDFINLLVAHKTNIEIAEQLQLNQNTIGYWRVCWCIMMKRWHLDALSAWCKKK